MQYYDLIFSLGRFCHTKILLDGLGLSTCGGPWDWSGTPVAAGIYQRLRMISEGFDRIFLKSDFSHLAFHPEFARDFWEIYRHALDDSWPHLCLFNKHTLSWYIHDGDANQSFDEQYPFLKEKLMRRIHRFLETLSTSSNTLAIYISNAVDQLVDVKLEHNELSVLLETISRRYPRNLFNIAIFEHDSSKHGLTYTMEYPHPQILLFTSNHHICPSERWLNMRGYRMPKSIATILRRHFSKTKEIS